MDLIKSYIKETKINDHYWKVKDTNDSCNLKDFYIYGLEASLTNKKIINNIRVFSTVKHSNLLESCFFQDKTNFYYIEEAATSKNIIERLRNLQNNSFETNVIEEQIVYWLFQILLALNKLHENDILHKRISKGWIVFVRDEIKLCINPLCTLLMSSTERVKIDSSECNFNAPELIEPGKLTLKYDIWSLGWLLFHMCTLENPFEYLQEPENFNKLTIPNEYSLNLRQLFKNMTDIDPDKRANCHDLLEDKLFTKYKYHFDKKVLFGSRYKLLLDDETGKFKLPLQVLDLNEKKNLKILKRHLKSTSNNFVKLMARADYIHTNIQTIDSMFEEDDFLYTVEQPLKLSLNMKLENILDTNKDSQIKVKLVLNWFTCLLDAIHYLHSNNIIHANICTGMIGFDQSDVIKLKFNENSYLVRSANEPVEIYDTSLLALNSPELLETPYITTKYDIYCLGWLLYTMCKLKDVSHDLKITRNFNQLKVIPELPVTYPNELNLIFKDMINIDYKKRPSAGRLNDLQFVKSIKTNNQISKIKETNFVEKETTFSEKRYEKMNISSRDDLSITYFVVDTEENQKKKILKVYDSKLFKSEYDISEINMLLDMSRNKPHPNIIVYSDLMLKPKLCIVSEFCTETLQKKLETMSRQMNRPSTLSFDYIKQAVEWLLQLANAIQHIHSLNIIHRDIRPRNIFLNKDTVKLGNFSFSKSVLDHLERSNKTDLNVYSYMSPEMINLKNYGAETDIWSFGCVLYEVLELKKAFDGDDFTEIYRSIEYEEAPTINSTFADIMIFNKDLLRRIPKMRPNAHGLVHVIKTYNQN